MGKKIVIIGGGVAGLSAGIYSRLNGFDTEIVEMHSLTGGQCTAWDRKGYRFDYCLHWLVGTRTGPFHEIWKETGVINNNVTIVDHDIHTKLIAPDGREFYIYTNLDRWEEYLCRMAPEDTRPIKKMCRDMRKTGLLEPFDDPPGLRKLSSYIKSLFNMLPVIILFGRYGKMNCNDYFKLLNFKNKDLRYFLESMFGGKDFSAIAYIMMLAWFNQKNAGYIIGGSLPMAKRMNDKFLSLGGKLTVNKRVSKILVNDNAACGVLTEDGEEIHADYVISAADGHSTIFDMLEGRYLSDKITDAYDNWELFTPLVQISFGIDKKYFTESANESFTINDIAIGHTNLKNGYSIMNYAFDSTMAPEGKSVIVIRYESPWDLWKNMSSESYRDEKKKISGDGTKLLEKRFPGITGHIEVTDVATPLTDVRYTGVWKGSYEGFMPGAGNLMKSLDIQLPGLKKFYMAGQWLSPGGGLPPAGQTGKWAIRFICKEEKTVFKNT
ncbi:MAG TPA: NAD(P)/FAD-dependent oxidoreductase [Bacteroidales bacterium]|nr:NAD(P)/FAD-dependent oxidoreductase [Bacteroidales bacterium]